MTDKRLIKLVKGVLENPKDVDFRGLRAFLRGSATNADSREAEAVISFSESRALRQSRFLKRGR